MTTGAKCSRPRFSSLVSPDSWLHTAARLLERGERVIGLDNVNDYYDVATEEGEAWRS